MKNKMNKQVQDTINKQVQDNKALQLLDTDVIVKYPEGSFISFGGYCDEGEKNRIVSCSWYDKVGGKKRDKRNTVRNPPEWQNIPYEEAEKIIEMFDKNIFLNLRYV